MAPKRKELPRWEERVEFLYLEQCSLVRDGSGLVARSSLGDTPVPAANLVVLLLGPGSSVTQPAATLLADCACPVAFCGEHGIRTYCFGQPLSGNVDLLYQQVARWSDPGQRLSTALHLLERRFGWRPTAKTLEEAQGIEGNWVGAEYQRIAVQLDVPWSGRTTKGPWEEIDAPNRALSAAMTCV